MKNKKLKSKKEKGKRMGMKFKNQNYCSPATP
jgi:hypothetical protein